MTPTPDPDDAPPTKRVKLATAPSPEPPTHSQLVISHETATTPQPGPSPDAVTSLEPPVTATLEPTKLDASSFPHITDGILDFLYLASPVAYLAAQGVCREWQKHIKERLFSHIIIVTKSDKPDEFHVETHPRALVLAHQSFPDGRMPVSLKAILHWVRVLDIRGPLPHSALKHIVTGVHRLETARFSNYGQRSFFPLRHVATTVTHPTCTISTTTNVASALDFREPHLAVVIYRDGDCFHLGCFDVLTASYSEKAVLIFLADPSRIEEVMRQFHSSLCYIPFARDTVVVVDRPTSYHETIINDIARHFESLRLERKMRDIDPAPHLKFMTHAEYRDHVGEETYQLHTWGYT